MRNLRPLPLAITLSILPFNLLTNGIVYAEQDSNRPPLLLAKDYLPDSPISAFFISEKLDGVRAYWNGKDIVSRSGKIIPTPSWFTQNFPLLPLDGELWIARGKFEELISVINSVEVNEEKWRKIKYMAFDLPTELSPFNVRYDKLKKLIPAINNPQLEFVKQFEVDSHKALQDHLDLTVAKGGEGLMLHRKTALYQAKRSLDLQKMKPFDDAEATVVAHIPGKGKYRGLLGAVEVINTEGKRFKIGSGFSLEDRRSPPPINSQITYRYRGKTRHDTPRFATFLRIKNDE